MDARKANIYKFLSGDKQYIIPVYQRIYSWEIEECKRLWFDIVDMQKKNKNGHFVGSIVSITENDSPSDMSKFTIIDGQQRITTLMLLLLALRDYAFIHREEKSINWKKINNSFLKNPDEDDDSQYKLLLTETDKDILISLIEKRPIDENLNSRLISNYNYFWLCHNKQLINIHFYRGVSELPYKLLFAVIYTHLEFRYEVSHTITSHHVHHFHQTRIPDGTLLDYMVQYRKPLFPQFFLYPKKFLPENNPHHKEFHLRPYIQNNANQ